MADGPRRVGDLLQLPESEGKRDNPAELVGILVGSMSPNRRHGQAPNRTPEALRFNRVTSMNLSRTENLGRPVAAASYALGTGAPCTLFDLYVIDRLQAGEREDRKEDWVRDLGGNLDDEERDKLRQVLDKALRVRRQFCARRACSDRGVTAQILVCPAVRAIFGRTWEEWTGAFPYSRDRRRSADPW